MGVVLGTKDENIDISAEILENRRDRYRNQRYVHFFQNIGIYRQNMGMYRQNIGRYIENIDIGIDIIL